MRRQHYNTVKESAENLISELADLTKLTELVDDDALDEWSNDELLALDIGYGQPGPLSVDQVREEAARRLRVLSLCVEATTTFEIVLETRGPDRRLVFVCKAYDRSPEGYGEVAYEITRVLYRFAGRWGSIDLGLGGQDREIAEALAHRVVPELVE